MGGKVSLANVNAKHINSVPYKGVKVKCIVCNVHDGDTCTIVFRFGKEFMKLNVRLQGLDAPELNAPDLEKEAGIAVRDELTRKLSHKRYWYVVMSKWDKYGGRVVGTILDKNDVSINQWLLDQQYVKPYDGGKKSTWTNAELRSIIKATTTKQ
jgi:endonuclease YncB( thermonuclease family)